MRKISDILTGNLNKLVKNADAIDETIYENVLKETFKEFKDEKLIKIGNDDFIPFGKPSIKYRAFDDTSNILTPQLDNFGFMNLDGQRLLSPTQEINKNITSNEDIYNYLMNSDIRIGEELSEEAIDGYYERLAKSKKDKSIKTTGKHPSLFDSSKLQSLKANELPVSNTPIANENSIKKRRTGQHQDGTLIGASIKEDLTTSNWASEEYKKNLTTQQNKKNRAANKERKAQEKVIRAREAKEKEYNQLFNSNEYIAYEHRITKANKEQEAKAYQQKEKEYNDLFGSSEFAEYEQQTIKSIEEQKFIDDYKKDIERVKQEQAIKTQETARANAIEDGFDNFAPVTTDYSPMDIAREQAREKGSNYAANIPDDIETPITLANATNNSDTGFNRGERLYQAQEADKAKATKERIAIETQERLEREAKQKAKTEMEEQAAKNLKKSSGKYFGHVMNIGIAAMDYKDSREAGNSVGKSVAKAGMEFAKGEIFGGWYMAAMVAKSAPTMVMSTVEGVNTMSRSMNSLQRRQVFGDSQFQDTQQLATMRQSGMELAKMSQYNLQQSLMGNEAEYMHRL